MFKNYQKYLKVSLKVYIFVLAIIVILKLIGLDYFGIDLDNKAMLSINDFVQKYNIEKLYYSITLFFHVYVYITVVNKENSKKIIKYCFIITILSILLKIVEVYIAKTIIITLIDLLFLTLACMIYNRFKNNKYIMKESLKLFLINVGFQIISLYLRNIRFYNINLSFLIRSILDFDYILMLLIYQKYVFIKGGALQCGEEVSLSLQEKTSLKNLQQKSHTNWQNKSKEDKITLIIYIILSLIWNILSLAIILFVAKLNNTLIECIFILTSFWISKRSFGKPFHLNSMAQCFFVSNVTYYLLNRITTPIGISIIIPVMLGVGLSYVTSKLVKKIYKPLYRGMPLDLFNETILKVVDIDSYKYKICYDYYIEMKSAVSLGLKYHYTDYGIRQICKRINDNIKRLN